MTTPNDCDEKCKTAQVYQKRLENTTGLASFREIWYNGSLRQAVALLLVIAIMLVLSLDAGCLPLGRRAPR